MTGFYLKFTLIGLMIFIIPVLLIRAQPYDDPELRALLMPPDCEMPCFMGIRPGVTTDDEAVSMLNDSGWAKSVSRQFNSDYDLIEWEWNGQQPGWLDTETKPSIKTLKRVVMSILVATNADFGNVELNLGRPSGRIRSVTDSSSRWLKYRAYYPQSGIILQTITLCSLNTRLYASAFVTYYDLEVYPAFSDSDQKPPVYNLCEY